MPIIYNKAEQGGTRVPYYLKYQNLSHVAFSTSLYTRLHVIINTTLLLFIHLFTLNIPINEALPCTANSTLHTHLDYEDYAVAR